VLYAGRRAREFEKEGSEERMGMGKPARRGHPDDLKGLHIRVLVTGRENVY